MDKRTRQRRHSEPESARRFIEVTVTQAREEAEDFDRELSEQPFWRFRRRRAIGRKLAEARERERRALRMLDG